jgi:molybdopterin/thiamine biosynthesis adenylyltransferase
MDRDALAAVLQELTARGFKARRQIRGIHRFEGTFDCRGEAVRVEFAFSNLEFLSYPSIKVLSGIDRSALTPHLSASGGLCYFQEGSVVLDRYDPAASVAQCLDQAHRILEQIKFNPEYRRQDIQDEFLVHWSDGSSFLPVLMGSVSPRGKSTTYWRASIGKGSLMILADEATEARALGNALGAASSKPLSCPCWLFKSDVPLLVPESMPKTVHELFLWLKDWDPALSKAVQKLLDTDRNYLQYGLATFAVHSIAGWICFGFELNTYMRASYRRRPSRFRQYLHKSGGGTAVFRYSVVEAGSDFVHSRNLSFPDLKNKTIVLVGCGAIGSYLAPALVRLGAGTGSGSLSLIDNGTLLPENLGRHSLGYSSLFKSKSAELAAELKRQFPMAWIIPSESNVADLPKLFAVDLVIDATGEEAVSEMLNAHRLAKASKTPLLHTWVLGNGEAVQTLWTQGVKSACYRCLTKSGPGQDKEERYPVLKVAPKRKQIACHAFTPFAVSAAMNAAALATEVVVDWLERGDPSPRFRTRIADNADVRKVKNQDPERLAHCPACSHAR